MASFLDDARVRMGLIVAGVLGAIAALGYFLFFAKPRAPPERGPVTQPIPGWVQDPLGFWVPPPAPPNLYDCERARQAYGRAASQGHLTEAESWLQEAATAQCAWAKSIVEGRAQ